MHKFKYLIMRIVKLDYKNMFKIARKISKKTNKNIVFIFIDMIYCGFKYQAGYYDYLEFEFYNLNKIERKTYITRGINNEIIRLYNDKNSFYKFDDKSYFNKLFNKYLKRDWIILTSYSKFEDFVLNKKNIIVKPIDGEGGIGVEKISIKKNTNLKNLYNKLIDNKQLLIEELIKQDSEMNTLYPNSVNTLRMFTFFDGKEAHFLYSVLKIGNGKNVDNFSSGGMYTFLNDFGKVIVPAIDKEDNIFYEHPITKKEIIGFVVPKYNEAIDLVKKASRVVKDVKYVGWDVAISKDGPVLVEGNCFPGVFQVKASLSNNKTGMLSKYKEYMDI